MLLGHGKPAYIRHERELSPVAARIDQSFDRASSTEGDSCDLSTKSVLPFASKISLRHQIHLGGHGASVAAEQRTLL